MSGDSLARFELNAQQASDLIGLSRGIAAVTTSAIDLNDILRAAIVGAVSALDYFVHEVVRERLIDICAGRRPPTQAYSRFKVSVGALSAAASGLGPETWMSEEIRLQHGHLSFQTPDKIADAVRLVFDGQLWREVASKLSSDDATVKRELELVVHRRNKIAHEADRDPTPPHDRWPISDTDSFAAVECVTKIARAIAAVLG